MAVLIKICGLTNMEDALFAAGAGADYLGFIFVPGTPRQTAPETVREIVRGLPPGVKTAGVFRDAPAAEIRRIMVFCGLDAVQLHGRETPETAETLADEYEVWKALPFTSPSAVELSRRYSGCTILADSDKKDGACVWEAARRAAGFTRLFLAGGLNCGNIAAALAAVRPAGVDICSGVEKSPGIKDHGKITSIITTVRGTDPMPEIIK